MLQYLVPNQLLGRIMALEMALFTVRLVPALLTSKTPAMPHLVMQHRGHIAHDCTL